jgi:hypothetical protein
VELPKRYRRGPMGRPGRPENQFLGGQTLPKVQKQRYIIYLFIYLLKFNFKRPKGVPWI